MSLLLLLQFGFALHPYYGTGRGQAHRPKEYNYSRPFGGGEFRPFGGCPISLLLPLSGCEEIGEQRQTNGSQRHRDRSAQNPADPSRSPPSLLQSPSMTERKDVE